ncbi:MAG: HNH endonuclease signature motif containing protein [Baekduia sp.]
MIEQADLRCSWCRRKRNILTLYFWRPQSESIDVDWHLRHAVLGFGPENLGIWGRDPLLITPYVRPAVLFARTRCFDPAACREYVDAKRRKAALRRKLFTLEMPSVPNAPMGTCRWCGETLTGENASRRNYCYKDREGRDCRGEVNRSMTWSARDAVRHRDFLAIGRLACVDCGEVCEEPDPERYAKGPLFIHSEHVVLKRWEADHELALEDGGAHELDNLRCRCVPCHRAKTARENSARRAT